VEEWSRRGANRTATGSNTNNSMIAFAGIEFIFPTAMKSASISTTNMNDSKYLDEMNDCLAEIEAIRRDMRKTDAEIRRLEASTRRKLTHLRTHLHVEKAA
jgi:hypothetical protein